MAGRVAEEGGTKPARGPSVHARAGTVVLRQAVPEEGKSTSQCLGVWQGRHFGRFSELHNNTVYTGRHVRSVCVNDACLFGMPKVRSANPTW